MRRLNLNECTICRNRQFCYKVSARVPFELATKSAGCGSITITDGLRFPVCNLHPVKVIKNADVQQVSGLLLRASHNLHEAALDPDDCKTIGTGQETPINGLTFGSIQIWVGCHSPSNIRLPWPCCTSMQPINIG